MKIHNITICEDARMEVNGKFMLIGVYGNEINIPVLPANFSFLIWFMVEHEKKGMEKLEIRGRLSGQEKDVIGFQADVTVENMDIWDPVGLASTIEVSEECELTIDFKLDAEWVEVRRIRFRNRSPVPTSH